MLNKPHNVMSRDQCIFTLLGNRTALTGAYQRVATDGDKGKF
jgi:hypothetical protein